LEVKLKRYPSLDGLRAISIIMVILFHLVANDHIPFHLVTDVKWLMPIAFLLVNGNLGVNVFFVISGFLITSLLLKEEIKGKISLKNFYIRRTIRIFPAYYFLILIYFVLSLLNLVEISQISWISSLTYTKYLFFFNHDPVTGHFWSLSVEEHFYLLWPLLFIGGAKVRKWSILLLICIVPFLKIYSHYYATIFFGNELLHNNSIFFRVDSIALGCLVAIYLDKILEGIKNKFLFLFRLSVFLLILIPFISKIPSKLGFENNFLLDVFFNSTSIISNILVVTIMLYSIFGPHKIWFKFLNSRVLIYIGVLSNSIYLYQQFFTAQYDYWVCQFPQNILFIFLSAVFSYHIIEKPFLKLKDKFSTKKNKNPLKNYSATNRNFV
jgi:peptidoglycan/LPS O-acetylase OafA/YrhL